MIYIIIVFSGIEPYQTHTVEDDPMKPISINFSKGIPVCGMFVDYRCMSN